MQHVESRLGKAWKSPVRFSLKQAKRILVAELSSDADDHNPDVAKVILLMGSHGIGKGRIVKQASEAAKVDYADWHVGATVFEDNAGLQEIAEDGGSRLTLHRASKGIPGFAPPKGNSGCLFHDEVFSGTIEHQNQLRMLISGRIGELTLHPGWKQVAATNPETVEYLTVKSVDEALASRFLILPIQPTREEKLIYWKDAHTLPPVLFEFLSYNPTCIDVVDSRTWANIGHSIRKWMIAKLPASLITNILSVNVDPSTAAAFMKFVDEGGKEENRLFDAQSWIDSDKDTYVSLSKRLEQWVAKGDDGRVGHVKFEFKLWLSSLKDAMKSSQIKDDKVKRIVEFMDIVCIRHADMVADLLVGTQISDELYGRLSTALYETKGKTQAKMQELQALLDSAKIQACRRENE